MKTQPLSARTIITVQRPMLWLLSFALLFVVLLLLLFVSFEYGRNTAGFDSASADAYIEHLAGELETSQLKIVESERQVIMLKRNSQIDGDASILLKETLSVAKEELLALKKELSFYKSIVAPELTGRSLALQAVELSKSDIGGYQYKVMVSQRGQNDKIVRGTISLSIKGVSDGKETTLAWPDVTPDVKKSMKLGFKYFQNFEGVMTLPVGFEPDLLQIEVSPKTSKIKALNEEYMWSELTAGGV